MRKLVLLALALVVLFVMCRHRPQTVRFATFNIEDFPQNARQIERAFDEIERTEAGFIAVQEIHDAAAFASAAQRRLGPSWRYVPAVPGERYDLGVVFDDRRFTLVSSRVLDDTRLGSNHKPTLEVRLAPADGSPILRILEIHFRCCSEGRPTRMDQHAALARIVGEARRSGDRLVVLGDFNATADADRADLARLAREAGLVWATEPLACTAFWSRDDGCPRSRLDHVLTWAAPSSVVAQGACATEGCAWQARCPAYTEEVSDHCPVVVTIPP